MKTIIKKLKFWVIAVAAVASAACSDLLDQRPQGQWTIDDIEGGAYFSQVMALYAKARHYNITAGIPAFAILYYRSEDSRKGSTTTDGAEHVPMYENFQYSAANSLLGPYWTQNYEIINAANTILDQMKKAQEAGAQLDEAELQCGMEARFFRGWCYFNLARAFGEVPLVDFAITSSDEANIPKTTVDKIYELIDADPTAAEALPRRWESKYIGRITYGTARALHAKAYAQRRLWSQMYQAAKDVIDTKVYNLDTPFNKIFREEGENSSESVWELQCTATPKPLRSPSRHPMSWAVSSAKCRGAVVRVRAIWAGAGIWPTSRSSMYSKRAIRDATRRCSTSRPLRSRGLRSLRRPVTLLSMNSSFRRMVWTAISTTRRPIAVRNCVTITAVIWVNGTTSA